MRSLNVFRCFPGYWWFFLFLTIICMMIYQNSWWYILIAFTPIITGINLWRFTQYFISIIQWKWNRCHISSSDYHNNTTFSCFCWLHRKKTIDFAIHWESRQKLHQTQKLPIFKLWSPWFLETMHGYAMINRKTHN